MKALLIMMLAVMPAWAQADCPTNTGNNASVFLMKDAYRSLHPGDTVRLYSEDRCVGQAVLPQDEALAYAVTVWGDDEITPEVDGAVAGAPISVALQKTSTTTLLDPEGVFADELTYAPDRLYKIISAEFDTTTAREIAELNARIDEIGAELDTAYAIADFLNAELQAERARGDSLETLVGQQLIMIDALQDELVAANATIDSLQTALVPCDACQDNLAVAEAQVAALQQEIVDLNGQLAVANDKLDQIAAIANSNKGRFREILDVLYP